MKSKDLGMNEKVVNSTKWWHYLNGLSPSERYELSLTGEPVIMKCVMCGKQNYKLHDNGHGSFLILPAAGKHLRFIYDQEDNDCICSECHDIVYEVTHNQEKYDRLETPKGDTWLKETEEFEKSLDTDWKIEDILKIIDAEEKGE